jgi:polar amino acid transport system substrate-binding protein
MSPRLSRVVPVLAVLLVAPGCFFGGGEAAPPRPAVPAAPAGENAIERILRTGELRVGLSGDQPPFNMRTREGDLIGLDPALANVLAMNLGVKARFVERSFGELLDALEAGQVDLVMSGMTITPERNARAAFVGPYYVSGKTLCTRAGTLAAAGDLSRIDSPGFRLAVVSGSTGERFVRRHLARATLVSTPTFEQAIKWVVDGGADALVVDLETCVFARLRNPDAGLEPSRTLTTEPIGIAIPPDEGLLANLLENYLDALEQTGALDRARRFWFEDPSWLRALP